MRSNIERAKQKLERRVAKLESSLGALIPLAEMGTAHWAEPANEVERARKLLGQSTNTGTKP